MITLEISIQQRVSLSDLRHFVEAAERAGVTAEAEVMLATSDSDPVPYALAVSVARSEQIELRLPHAHELKCPPDGLTPAEYRAWDLQYRQGLA